MFACVTEYVDSRYATLHNIYIYIYILYAEVLVFVCALLLGQICTVKVSKYGFGNVGYGFALPKNSPYTKELTIEIYRYRESGMIDSLDAKWFVL